MKPHTLIAGLQATVGTLIGRARAMDSVGWSILIGGVCVVAVIFAGGVITLANRDSESVVLGFAALFGAVVLFSVQLFFHLRSSTSEATIGTQIVVNHTAPAANALQPANLVRADGEKTAAAWLAAKSPDLFADNNKLARDLIVLSILNYFTAEVRTGGPRNAHTPFQRWERAA